MTRRTTPVLLVLALAACAPRAAVRPAPHPVALAPACSAPALLRYELGTVRFGPRSAQLDPEAEGLLRANAQVLAQLRGFYLVIDGYSDDTGTEAQARTVSEARAEAVLAYYQAHGLDPEVRGEFWGHGRERLECEAKTPACRRANRRATTTVFQIVHQEEAHKP